MSIRIIGKNAAREAIESGKTILEGFAVKGIQPDLLRLAESRHVRMTILDKASFDVRFPGNTQGIVLEAEEYRTLSLEESLVRIRNVKNPLYVMLDGIEDPHNFGAIIRSAEAGGASGIIIPKNRNCGVTSTVVKVSCGAIEHLDIVEVTNLNQTIEKLKQSGFWIVGTDLQAEKRYDEIVADVPLCLIIGNEGKGVSRLVRENADYNVKIPMAGKTNSLNASVSAGILIFEILRKRTG